MRPIAVLGRAGSEHWASVRHGGSSFETARLAPSFKTRNPVSCSDVRTLHPTYTWSEVHAFLDLIGPARNLRPRYNIAPTTTIDVARLGEGGRELVPMRWGLSLMVEKAA